MSAAIVTAGPIRRWAFLAGFVLALSLLALGASQGARADAADPFTINVQSSGLTVTLSGTWRWERGECNDRWTGWAVDWGDPNAPGHLVPADEGPDYYVGTPSDNTVHMHNPPDCGQSIDNKLRQGTWGPISHTYSEPGEYSVCAIMYDVHHRDGVLKKTTGTHGIVAGGEERNKDNSAETNNFVKDPNKNCAPATFVLKTPTPAPTPTPSPSPTPTATPCPDDPSKTPMPGGGCPTPTPTATATPTATPCPDDPTKTPMPGGSCPTPTPTATPTATPCPDDPTKTPMPGGSCPTPTPCACPTPSPTPAATPTPTPPATPTPVITPSPTPNNRTCLDSDPSLTMVELHSGTLGNLGAVGSGQFGDGTLTVNISSYTGSSFAWTSNIGLDSVFARTAGGGSLKEYQPEATSGSVNAGGSITFISFCYDHSAAPTPTMPPTDFSFGSGGGAGLSGLTVALLMIVGLAAAVVVGSHRRSAATAAATGTRSVVWSTQTTPSRRRDR
jgi:hypothetical protein